jgi:hypothetical protein
MSLESSRCQIFILTMCASDGFCVSTRPESTIQQVFTSLCSNKAVLNTAPELPLLFLLIQLIIAVVLLHISAFFTKRVELPVIEKEMAKNLTPVVLVNVIGLVFNTLCLRDVETTFFQVCTFLPLSVLEADS